MQYPALWTDVLKAKLTVFNAYNQFARSNLPAYLLSIDMSVAPT